MVLMWQEMAYTEAGLIVMCPPVIIIGCALIINTIGVAGLAGVGVCFFLCKHMIDLTYRSLL